MAKIRHMQPGGPELMATMCGTQNILLVPASLPGPSFRDSIGLREPPRYALGCSPREREKWIESGWDGPRRPLPQRAGKRRMLDTLEEGSYRPRAGEKGALFQLP